MEFVFYFPENKWVGHIFLTRYSIFNEMESTTHKMYIVHSPNLFELINIANIRNLKATYFVI